MKWMMLQPKEKVKFYAKKYKYIYGEAIRSFINLQGGKTL